MRESTTSKAAFNESGKQWCPLSPAHKKSYHGHQLWNGQHQGCHLFNTEMPKGQRKDLLIWQDGGLVMLQVGNLPLHMVGLLLPGRDPVQLSSRAQWYKGGAPSNGGGTQQWSCAPWAGHSDTTAEQVHPGAQSVPGRMRVEPSRVSGWSYCILSRRAKIKNRVVEIVWALTSLSVRDRLCDLATLQGIDC